MNKRLSLLLLLALSLLLLLFYFISLIICLFVNSFLISLVLPQRNFQKKNSYISSPPTLLNRNQHYGLVGVFLFLISTSASLGKI